MKKRRAPITGGIRRHSGRTRDSFTNFAARIGVQTENLSAGGSYLRGFLTRNWQLLSAMYRSSWIVGQAVDVVAEDMTRAGISIQSEQSPDKISKIDEALERLFIWQKLNELIKWSRLYGGAIAVILIEGQKLDTPLRIETVGKGQFKGLQVLDRWLLQPDINNLISELGPDYGKPAFYTVGADTSGIESQIIHHSRLIRMDGIELPYWERRYENFWGMSVIERLFDRLVAFDSTTQGAAQLVYKAHLRTYSVDGLRDVIAAGGAPYEGLLKQIDLIRLYQSIEGMTLMDASDKFEAHSYSFSGLSDVLLQFGQQLSGALQIPLVRLFGQSPAGLNSTGDADIRNYYDTINSQQESRLKRPLWFILDLISRSENDEELPNDFSFQFNPLWQMSDLEKATMANAHTNTILTAVESSVIDYPTALKELKQSSRITGVWGNITGDMIKDAENNPPDPFEGEAGPSPPISGIPQPGIRPTKTKA